MLRGQKILPGTEKINFWWPGTRKYCFLVLWGQKILIFGVQGIEDFAFLVLWGQNILNFGALGTENIDFWCSGDRKY